jgi:hypothetical protein
MGPGAGINPPDGKMLSGMFTTTKVSETHAWRRFQSLAVTPAALAAVRPRTELLRTRRPQSQRR